MISVAHICFRVHFESKLTNKQMSESESLQRYGHFKEVSQVTKVTKQLKPAAQSKGFENVDLQIQLHSYQNDGCTSF
jgi:hypothetical protein